MLLEELREQSSYKSFSDAVVSHAQFCRVYILTPLCTFITLARTSAFDSCRNLVYIQAPTFGSGVVASCD